MCFATMRTPGAKPGIRHRDDRTEELRLLASVECLFQIIGQGEQLRLTQECAVDEHSRWSSRIANADWKRQVWITGYGGPGRICEVRRNDGVEIIGGKCVIDSSARCVGRVCSRGHVNRIGRIAAGLFRELEDFLAIVNQLLPAMRVVEG